MCVNMDEAMTPVRRMTALYLLRGEEILLLHRSGGVALGKWVGAAGGHFAPEDGDDPTACVLRELKEETGLDASALEQLQLRYVTKRWVEGELRQNFYFFAGLKQQGQLTSAEGELRWFPLAEVPGLAMPPSARAMMDHYLHTGRHDARLYRGAEGPNGMTFAPEEGCVVEAAELSPAQKAAFYALAAEYLPDSDQARVRSHEEAYGCAYLAMVEAEQVVGVAYGWPRRLTHPEDPSFMLDGIAVRQDRHRRGYGRRLLAAFEAAAGAYGTERVSVGSAGGYVEQFYMACGYRPVAYKLWGNGGPVVDKFFDSLQDYLQYDRPAGDGFVVMEKDLT